MNHGNFHDPDRWALKKKYLGCFDNRATNAARWREVVTALMDQGISRDTLVNWAVDAGHSRITVSSIVCRILVSLGLRERRKGAGRKPSPDALELLQHARVQYGERFLKILRAALSAGRAQLAAGGCQSEPWAGAVHISSAKSKLRMNGENCRTAIRRSTEPGGRPRHGSCQSLGTIFKRNLNTTTVRTKTHLKEL
jgi:hypothetical protein